MGEDQSRQVARQGLWLVLSLSLLKFLAHLASNCQGDYGFLRDELYYLACGARLAPGYVDMGCLTPILAAWSESLFGQTLWAFRLIPALAGAGTVFLAGAMARRLGGGPFAQGLAALAVLIAPLMLIYNSFFSISGLEVFLITLLAYLLLLLFTLDRPAIWIAVGAVLGLCLLNKFTLLLFAMGLVTGLVLTSQRRQLKQPLFWMGAAVALLIALPGILWQVQNGWPSLEYIKVAFLQKDLDTPLSHFFLLQALLFHPLTLPIWVAGLFFLFIGRSAGTCRPLGWIFLLPLVLLIISHSNRPDRLAPAFPFLAAAGAVAWERGLLRLSWAWLKPAALVLLAAGGLVFAPLALPILSPEKTVAYMQGLGMPIPLPVHLADRLGWEEMARNIIKVYETLPPEERKATVILAGNYGEASAIEHFGKAANLPQVLCGHNSYYHWGPGSAPAKTAIALGWPTYLLHQAYEEVQKTTLHSGGDGVHYEKNLPIYLCRKPGTPLTEDWLKVKSYYVDTYLDL